MVPKTVHDLRAQSPGRTVSSWDPFTRLSSHGLAFPNQLRRKDAKANTPLGGSIWIGGLPGTRSFGLSTRSPSYLACDITQFGARTMPGTQDVACACVPDSNMSLVMTARGLTQHPKGRPPALSAGLAFAGQRFLLGHGLAFPNVRLRRTQKPNRSKTSPVKSGPLGVTSWSYCRRATARRSRGHIAVWRSAKPGAPKKDRTYCCLACVPGLVVFSWYVTYADVFCCGPLVSKSL